MNQMKLSWWIRTLSGSWSRVPEGSIARRALVVPNVESSRIEDRHTLVTVGTQAFIRRSVRGIEFLELSNIFGKIEPAQNESSDAVKNLLLNPAPNNSHSSSLKVGVIGLVRSLKSGRATSSLIKAAVPASQLENMEVA